MAEVSGDDYNPHRRVAVIFDFDDTLLPDSTSALLRSFGVDPTRFWREEAEPLVRRGYDPTLAWLNLLVAGVGETGRFGMLNRDDLKRFGEGLRPTLYSGIDSLGSDLRLIARRFGWAVDLFVVSGGLEDVVRGALSATPGFSDFYGSLLDETGDPARLGRIMRAITFTEKTRYLFEINKGISSRETLEQPYAVNKAVPRDRRPVPMSCMIYVGDGLTDIPCFSLITEAGGFPFGVFRADRSESVRKAFSQLAVSRRTLSLHSPKYGPSEDLGALIREAVVNICGRGRIAR